MNFAEAFLDRKLNGRVLTSALKSDMVCTYEVNLPDDIMENYVKECPGINSFLWKGKLMEITMQKIHAGGLRFCLSAEESMLLSLCF